MELDIIVLELQEGIIFRTEGLKKGKVSISIFTEEKGENVEKIKTSIVGHDETKNIQSVEFNIEKGLCFKTHGLQNGVIMLQVVKTKKDY